jgi:hypothetical protein
MKPISFIAEKAIKERHDNRNYLSPFFTPSDKDVFTLKKIGKKEVFVLRFTMQSKRFLYNVRTPDGVIIAFGGLDGFNSRSAEMKVRRIHSEPSLYIHTWEFENEI